jgi:hypothetical protein
MPESTDPASATIRLALTVPEAKAACYACEFSLDVFADERTAPIWASALGVAHQKFIAGLERAGA